MALYTDLFSFVARWWLVIMFLITKISLPFGDNDAVIPIVINCAWSQTLPDHSDSLIV